ASTDDDNLAGGRKLAHIKDLPCCAYLNEGFIFL
ncbi:MAG: hypothetical protein ACJAX5_002716, partial [Patiriisocius sp.]